MLEENLIAWSDKIRKEALKEARKEAHKEAFQEGRVLTLRKVLLEQMRLRFGRVPEKVRSRVEEISSTRELERLTRKVLSAKSLEDMGILHRTR